MKTIQIPEEQMETKDIVRKVFCNTQELTSTGYWTQERFLLPEIGAGEEVLVKLPMNGNKGYLIEVNFASESGALDLSILVHPNAPVPSLDCIYTKAGINRINMEATQKIWSRGDANNSNLESALWALLKNNGGPSGETVLELVYQVHGV
jgi:hypothetical protein